MEDSIRQARTDAGLTQKQLANLIGVLTRTVERWESGERKCAEYQEKLIIEKIRREYFVPLGGSEDILPEPVEQFEDTFDKFVPAGEKVELFLEMERDAKAYLADRLSQNLIDRGCRLAKKAFENEFGWNGVSGMKNPYLRSMEIVFGHEIMLALLALTQSQIMLVALDFCAHVENKTAYYCNRKDHNNVYILRLKPDQKQIDSILYANLENMKTKFVRLSKFPEEIALAAEEYFKKI